MIKNMNTPGPWKRVYDPRNGPKYYKHNIEGNHGQSLGWVDNKADAELMAAAPKMQDALRDALDYLEGISDGHTIVNIVREALTASKGNHHG